MYLSIVVWIFKVSLSTFNLTFLCDSRSTNSQYVTPCELVERLFLPGDIIYDSVDYTRLSLSDATVFKATQCRILYY